MKYNGFKLLLLVILMFSSLNAYESEDKLKVIIIGKVIKYITWQNQDSKNFIITILKNNYGDLFDKIYKDKKVYKKPIKIVYIDSIDELGETNILYVSENSANNLSTIIEKTKDKNILLVGDIRGLAQKGGTMQIYFSSQKIKLRINLDVANRDSLKFKSTLLRIADVIREDT